jgi:hypothetical protein
MTDQKADVRVFTYACAACIAALGFGIFVALGWGGAAPGWLLCIGLASVSMLALLYGFSLLTVDITPYLAERPVQGAACICLGIILMHMPIQFLMSAFCIGIGTKLVWRSACDLAGQHPTPATPEPEEKGEDDEASRVGTGSPGDSCRGDADGRALRVDHSGHSTR